MSFPRWLYGTDLTAITIQGAIVAGGALSLDGAVRTLTLQTRSVVPELRIENRDVRAVNSLQINEVRTGQGFGLRLSILQEGLALDELTNLVFNYIYARVSFTAGAQHHVGWFNVSGWTGGVQDLAENPVEVTLGPVDPGAPLSQYGIT